VPTGVSIVAGVEDTRRGADGGREGPAEPSRTGHRTRVRSLDGLRGVAALVVVVHHVLLVSSPALANPYRSDAAPRPPTGSLDWWLSDTPLHIVWAGPEAVIIFFALSGFVLAIPAVRRGGGWLDRSYYPRRLLRLYLPVWGAMIVAVAIRATHSTTSVRGATWVLNDDPSVTLSGVVHTASVVDPAGTTMQFTGVLWSLQWEMLFSLLLPALLVIPLLTAKRVGLAAAVAGAALLVVAVGVSHQSWGQPSGFLQYMPVFVLGTLFAFHHERFRRRDGSHPRSFVTATTGVAAVGLLTVGYWTEGRGMASASWPQEIGIVVGALLALWLALNSPALIRLFETRVGQWLGSRSFSLYLVHYPIVAALAFAYGGRPHGWLLLLTAVPAALVGAELFWRAVEHPATSLARRAGDAAVTVRRPRRLPPVPVPRTPAGPG
jgi:peptidoglycan/LPS O-acetylase OafA/YrhL